MQRHRRHCSAIQRRCYRQTRQRSCVERSYSKRRRWLLVSLELLHDGAGSPKAAVDCARQTRAFAGQTVCVPPGTYMVTEDVNINNDGVTVNAPSGATLMFRNSVQWFVRGSSNTIQNIYIDCQGTPFSGFVILGSNNHFTGSSVGKNCFSGLRNLIEALLSSAQGACMLAGGKLRCSWLCVGWPVLQLWRQQHNQ